MANYYNLIKGDHLSEYGRCSPTGRHARYPLNDMATNVIISVMDNQELKKRLQEIRDILILTKEILSWYRSYIPNLHISKGIGESKISVMIDEEFSKLINNKIVSIESNISNAIKLTDVPTSEEPQEKVRKNERWQQVCLYAAMGCFFIISGLTGYYAFDEVNITIAPNSSSESPGQEGGRCRCDSPTSSGSPLGMFLGLGVSATVMLSISATFRRRE